MNTNVIPFNRLTKQLAIIGILSSCIVAITALLHQDFVLFYFTLGFASLTLVTLLLISLDKLDLAIHILLLGFIGGFTFGPLYGITYLSGILIYPMIMIMVIFFRKDPLTRFLYAIICFVGCFFFIYKVKTVDFSLLNTHYSVEFLISFGLFTGLFIVGYNYFSVMFKYQHVLEQNEKLLQNKNAELSQYIDSNLQLENFAHLASHELKTPLRNILNFSQLLSVKLDDRISEKEKEMVNIIKSQAIEMDELIKDLFDLSSVSNEPMSATELELPLLINNLIKLDFEAQKDWIKVKSIPSNIIGNRSYIKEVFKNLITNALKFVAPDKKPEIVIDCEERTNKFEFSIKDNGIGISDEMREKVFLIFKRLHTRKEYEGTGIGLAICKKIIERHLGEIWIESNPTGGTIFKFTIAKNLA